MVLLLLVQLYVVPVPAKLTTGVFDWLHTVILLIGFTTGVGFTVMVICWLLPEHVTPPFKYCGVTVKVPTKGFALLAFVAVKAAIFPLPEAPNPIPTVLLVQA